MALGPGPWHSPQRFTVTSAARSRRSPWTKPRRSSDSTVPSGWVGSRPASVACMVWGSKRSPCTCSGRTPRLARVSSKRRRFMASPSAMPPTNASAPPRRASQVGWKRRAWSWPAWSRSRSSSSSRIRSRSASWRARRSASARWAWPSSRRPWALRTRSNASRNWSRAVLTWRDSSRTSFLRAESSASRV